MARIPVGKIGVAPCGHRGEHIIGQYVQCLQGCEVYADDAPTVECCPRCGSGDIDDEYQLDPLYLQWNPMAERFDRRCFECGALWSTDP